MSDPGIEFLRWTDLWAAVAAALEMCVIQGTLGAGLDLGNGGEGPFTHAIVRT